VLTALPLKSTDRMWQAAANDPPPRGGRGREIYFPPGPAGVAVLKIRRATRIPS
jgi:hypothetical protein